MQRSVNTRRLSPLDHTEAKPSSSPMDVSHTPTTRVAGASSRTGSASNRHSRSSAGSARSKSLNASVLKVKDGQNSGDSLTHIIKNEKNKSSGECKEAEEASDSENDDHDDDKKTEEALTGDGETEKQLSPIQERYNLTMNKYKGKSLSLEDGYDIVTEYMNILQACEEYDTSLVLKIIKKFGNMYFSMKKHRKDIARKFIECGFPAMAVTMYKYYNHKGIFDSDNTWFPVYHLLQMFWNYTDQSKEICEALCESGFIKLMRANITHQPYLELKESKNVGKLLKASLSIIQNVCGRATSACTLYQELNIKQAMSPFLESSSVMMKTLAIMTLCKILPEDENKQLTAKGVIHFMTKSLRNALKSKTRRSHGFKPAELVDTLNRIAVNDSNKQQIVESGALPLLTEMMQQSEDEDEQVLAATTIWTLSFDDEVRQKITHEPGCVEALETLSTSENKTVKKMASGALWKIHGKNDIHRQEAVDGDSDKKHIFISYNWDHQDMVLRVKDRLKAEGHRVWIDVEQMGGSTLEAMAHAVENASVVLVCLSEKYKQSPNCRTEAEYTFQLKKPIIPLMLQRRYKPDGWLGMLCGAKMYINFDGKYEFDYAYDMLKREMAVQKETLLQNDHGKVEASKQVMVPPKRNVAAPPPIVMATAAPMLQKAPAVAPAHSTKAAFVTWTEDEVKQWVEKSELSGCDIFGKMNGKKLLKFCHMKSEAPEFFYNYLCMKQGINLMDVLQLTEAMDKLQ